MITGVPSLLVAAIVVATTLIVGGGPGPSGASAQSKPTVPVVFRTDFLFNGYISPWALGKAKGFFKEEGIDIDIQQGKGSGLTAQTVGSGVDHFGMADSGTVVQAIAQGAPLKIIAVYVQKNPIGFITHSNVTIAEPKDLLGRPVISSTGNAELKILPAVLAKYNMKMEQLDLRLVAIGARIPTFLQNKDAVMLGFKNGDYVRTRVQEPTARFKFFADFGVQIYSTGLIANARYARENPEVVRRFLAATTRSWQHTVQHPEEAIASALAAFPDLNRRVLTESLQVTLADLLHTPATQGQVIGWTAESDWKGMFSVLQTYAGMPQVKNIGDYQTNEFLPRR
jgi:NitT/TauT family transport system substrate-binding protein